MNFYLVDTGIFNLTETTPNNVISVETSRTFFFSIFVLTDCLECWCIYVKLFT